MSAPAAKIPSLARRIAFASLRLVGLLVVFVLVPLGVLRVLSDHGITPPLSFIAISTVGIALAVLGAAATIARPTRAYGPIALAGAVLLFLYLFTLARNGVITIPTGNGGALQLAYGNAVLLLVLMPILTGIAAAFTIWEDLRKPGERLPYDFPP